MENNKLFKNIEVGKFYFIHDGSNTGHPGLVVWKNDEFNLYLLIKFGTTPNKNNKPLNHSIGGGATKSYIYKRPYLAKRKDLSLTHECDFSYKDDNLLVTMISQLKPIESKSIKRKDRYHFRRLFANK